MASAAQAPGLFEAEIVPVEVKGREGPALFAMDEHNRPDTTLEAPAGLRPVPREGGAATAGKAPALNSGAAAMIVAECNSADEAGLEPRARIVSFGISAVEPGVLGIGPVPAVHQALERAGGMMDDLDRVEINGAFAAIALVLLRDLGLPKEIVNLEGGAIAHGHPIWAIGAVLTTRLLHSMKRDGPKRGFVTLCVGGGRGIAPALAMLWEIYQLTCPKEATMPDPKFTKPWHGIARQEIHWNPTIVGDVCIGCETCVTGCSRLVCRFEFERKKPVVYAP